MTRYSPREIERALDRFRGDGHGDADVDSGIVVITEDMVDEDGEPIPEKLAEARPDPPEDAEELPTRSPANEIHVYTTAPPSDDPPRRGDGAGDEANQ